MGATSLVSQSSSGLLRFDSFELDLRTAELRKRGIRLRLQGQPLQVLAILLKSWGRLVTREELRTHLWSADTFVDFDHSLHNAIGRVREVLGDSAETPRYIETLPRRGYRFIAPVEQVSHSAPQAASVSQSAPSAPADSSSAAAEVLDESNFPPAAARALQLCRRRTFSLLTVFACCALALAGWFVRVRFFAEPAVSAVRSIAVLPMGNLSGDAAQDTFADGMTEQLISDLSRIPGLKVTSRTSVMEYKGTKKHLPQIARELGVDGIVEGSVRREGDQVRITVQLLDGPNDRHLWCEDYEREERSALRLQSEIAQAIAEQIRLRVNPQQRNLYDAKGDTKNGDKEQKKTLFCDNCQPTTQPSLQDDARLSLVL